MKKFMLGAVLAMALLTASPLFGGKIIAVQKEKAYAEPTDDTAVVYVVRPAFMGKAVKTWAFVGEELIGANKGKHYTFATIPPGRHVFWSKAENTSALELDVEAGKTYYLKQGIKMGGLKARVELQIVGEEEGKQAIRKCKYTRLTEEGRQRAKEIVASNYDGALQKADTERR